jgi:hypothetical protein
MKLVIFGAGASYDCLHQLNNPAYDNSYRPPLNTELFGQRKSIIEILKIYPGAESFRSEIFLAKDIEEFFQEKWEFIENNRSLELMAKIVNTQYYLQHLFHVVSKNFCEEGLSNYEAIVNKAYEYSIESKEEVCFISFNYDILLEKAFEKLYHTRFNNIESYIKYPLKLIKPHGSCNWYSKFKQPIQTNASRTDIANHLYQSKLSLLDIQKNLEKEYTILEDPGFRTQSGGVYGFVEHFPRILIPLKSKDEFILPKNHLDCLTHHLNKVTEILIVGWKGSEEHFKNLLKRTIGDRKIEITLVTCEDETPKENLTPILPKAEFFMFKNKNEGSFSSYVRSIHNKSYENFFKVNKS